MAEHATGFVPGLTPENIDAVLSANIAVAKGYGTLAKHVLGQTRDSFEEAIEAGRKLSAAKSIDGLFEIQTELAQKSVKAMFDRSKAFSALTATVFKEMSAPFNGGGEAKTEIKQNSVTGIVPTRANGSGWSLTNGNTMNAHPQTLLETGLLTGDAHRYRCAGPEPRLADMLCDPIVGLVMRRDKVSPGEVFSIITQATSRAS